MAGGDAVQRAKRRGWGSWLALALIAAGFMGLDNWFYAQVSLGLNVEYERCFYSVTRPFWLFVRAALASLPGVALGLVLLGVLGRTSWRTIVCAIAAVAVAALSANVAQIAFGRPRPNQSGGAGVFHGPRVSLEREAVSFPSGEAATSFAGAAVWGRIIRRGRRAWYALAALAAVARLINGAHYVSDVVAGAWLGAMLAGSLFPWLAGRAAALFPGARRAHAAAWRTGTPGHACGDVEAG